jgi:hypothetical protein
MANRLLLGMAGVLAALPLGACVGSTEPATEVTNVSAKLNAKGYTNDGPARWWWEYDTVQSELGTASDTEVCGNPPEADRRCGPAQGGSQSNQIPLSVTVTGLTPATTYYFRACGQDTNDSRPACGQVRSFTTLAGTSYVLDRKWGTRGDANGQFDYPADVSVDRSDRVYVADANLSPDLLADRIQRFSSTGGFLTAWSGTGGSRLDWPTAVATDPQGNVYVGDYGLFGADRRRRVQKFTANGNFLFAYGLGYFTAVHDLATDAFGNVYIADKERIEKHDSSGNFITRWGGPGSRIQYLGLTTDGAGFVYAHGINFQSPVSHRVDKFTADGSFVGQLTIREGGDRSPMSVATDSAGYVYVGTEGSDPAELGDEIQKFSPTGQFITRWGSGGSGDGQFDSPQEIAVDSRGNVYVADSGNHRIQRFKPTQ